MESCSHLYTGWAGEDNFPNFCFRVCAFQQNLKAEAKMGR